MQGSSGPPLIWVILSLRFGQENISIAILPLEEEELCLLMAKDCAFSTGKLPQGLPRNSVVRVTDNA